MVGTVTVPPVAPVTTVTPDISNLSTLANQNASAAFAVNVALQDTNALLGLSSSSGSGAASPTDDVVLQDSLTNLSPQALEVLSATDNITTAGGAVANSNLTPTQLQEMQILQADIAQIEAAEGGSTPSITVTENGIPVNLSVAAVNSLNDITAVNNISSANELTAAQIQQAATAIAPFLGQPLTPQVVTQIQSALVTAGFNPEQLSLQNLFISMNYAAAETGEAHSPDTIALNEMVTEMETME